MKHNDPKLRAAGLIGAAIAAMHCGASASAQSQEGGAGLEEILVTARRFEENLQQTPVAVTSINAEAIEAQGIATVFDIARLTPNLTMTSNGASEFSSSIRGIGTTEPLMTIDPKNGLYVDGVYLARQVGVISDLVDLEQVQVLRGPQGTLFGRNTTGGAMVFTTAKPADEFGARATIGFGNYAQFKASGSLDTGSWGESGFSMKLSAVHGQRDGWSDNLMQPDDSRDPGSQDYTAAQVRARWSGEAASLDYNFYYFDQENYIPAFQMMAARSDVLAYLNQSPANGGLPPQVQESRVKKINMDFEGPQKDRIITHAVTAEIPLGTATLRSITAYREWDNTTELDLDGNGGLLGFVVNPTPAVRTVNLFAAENSRRQGQVSQEFNLFGDLSERLSYVGGAFYFHEYSEEDNPQFFTVVLGNGAFGFDAAPVLKYSYGARSLAGFGQLQWTPDVLGDRLRLSGGLRYTDDEKRLEQGLPVARREEGNWDNLSWVVSADYQWTDAVLGYARIASGYNSGGFNARSGAGALPYKPEEVISYEAGIKSEFLDRRLRVNVAVFFSDYDDIQINQFQAGSSGASSETVNAGKAEFTGLELELAAVLTPGLTFDASLGLIDPEYKTFLFRDPATGVITDVADVARFQVLAETTGAAGLQWSRELGDLGQVRARVGYTYTSERYWHPIDAVNPFNELIAQKPMNMVDAQLSLSGIDVAGTDLGITLWGRNLTDEEWIMQGIDFGALGYAGARYGDPRTYGVEFTARF